MKKIVLTLVLAISTIITSFGQKEDLIKYLDAYKTSEFEESKTIVSDYSFSQNPTYILASYSDISGLDFSTDTSIVKGYKAIFMCKLQNKAGGYIEKKMMVIMYFDYVKNHYSVFSFREPVSDPSYEAQQFKTHIIKEEFYLTANGWSNINKKGAYDDKKGMYRSFVYWSLLSGHIKDAIEYNKIAISLEEKYKNDTNNITLTNILK